VCPIVLMYNVQNPMHSSLKGFPCTSSYSEKFESKFCKIPSWKLAEVNKLLTCGKINQVFVWSECHDCKIVLAVPFSCKSRLCLFCYRKKLFGWSIQLSRILNPELPHYHIVFTLPGRLNKKICCIF
jgi:hypothetical protein